MTEQTYTISIEGLDKAEVLAALYNAAKPQGMGFLQYDPAPMEPVEAASLLTERGDDPYFDYLKGRVMKISLAGDDLNPRLYDRDNGFGACAAAIAELRTTGDVNSEATELRHRDNTLDAARLVNEHLYDKSYTQDGNHMLTVGLGLDDVADLLKPHLDETLKDDPGAVSEE